MAGRHSQSIWSFLTNVRTWQTSTTCLIILGICHLYVDCRSQVVLYGHCVTGGVKRTLQESMASSIRRAAGPNIVQRRIPPSTPNTHLPFFNEVALPRERQHDTPGMTVCRPLDRRISRERSSVRPSYFQTCELPSLSQPRTLRSPQTRSSASYLPCGRVTQIAFRTRDPWGIHRGLVENLN